MGDKTDKRKQLYVSLKIRDSRNSGSSISGKEKMIGTKLQNRKVSQC
jgi:hypothetical protein